MDLNSVNMFVSVIDAGSFSGAAKKTGIPVATVSRRISELEKQLGVRLMERSTRHLRLTQAGEILYEYADRGLQELNAAKLAIENRETELKGTLRLSLPPNFEPWWLLIQGFQDQYPNVEVEALVSERKFDMIENDIDVALRVGDVRHQTAIGRSLLSYRHILVASPAFIEKHGEPASPLALTDFPCAVWHMRSEKSVWRFKGKNVEIAPFLRVNDYSHLKWLVLQGHCITELPPFLAAQAIKDGTLVALLKPFPLPDYEVSLVYPSRQQLSRIVRVYIDYCLQAFDSVML